MHDPHLFSQTSLGLIAIHPPSKRYQEEHLQRQSPSQSTKKAKNDSPEIAVDEEFAREFMTEIAGETGHLVGELIHPGAGHIFSAVFKWVMKLISRMLRINEPRENESSSMEEEQEQE